MTAETREENPLRFPLGCKTVTRENANHRRLESSLHAATNLDFECEVFLEILDDHHQEWQFDTQSLLGISRASDECGADVSAHNLNNQ
jgi:hypothetical protein